MASAAVKRYWGRLVLMGCIITGGPAEIAHCHGGSIVERMQEPKARGKKLARYDWLVLPLAPQLHRYGPYALDLDVRAWERRFGTQASYIDLLAGKTGINLWELARGKA
jgi:hypothetical protein